MNTYDAVMRYGLLGWLEGTDRQDNGNTWFVDGTSGNSANSADSGQGASWDKPFSTVNYAISRCSNGAGDVILVAAGHTETIADTNDSNVSGTTTDEFCVDKSGVTIIGLGSGTRRPKFTLATATDACIDVRNANCTLYNLVFYNTIDSNTAMLSATADANGLTIENCMFYESANDAQALAHIVLAAAMTDVTLRGNRHYNVAGGTPSDQCIEIVGAITRLKIHDCVFRGDWNEHLIDGDAAAGYDVEIIGNYINQYDATVGSAVTLHSSTTGVVAHNVIHCPNGTDGSALEAAGCLLFDNNVTINEGVSARPYGGTIGGTNIANHWYVDAGIGSAAGAGTSWETALSTIDAAIAKCTESNGDVIHVAPGHTENVGTAGIVGDKAGITILGHGYGESKPFVTFTTNAAAALTITSDNIRVENIKFGCNVASQNHMIDVDGDDLHIINCEFVENGQTPLSCITADTTGGSGHGDGLKIIGCRFYMPTDENLDNCIDLGCDITDVTIKNNYFLAAPDEAVIEIPAGGNACQEVMITDNVIICEKSGIHCIEIEETALTVTGVIARNTCVSDNRYACIQQNIMCCHDNTWADLGGNLAPVQIEAKGNTPGNNIYVDSALGVDDTAHGTCWEHPVDTIDYAIGLCTANNGDTIHVAPGHVEDLAEATIDFDQAGITCIGYGNGLDRPTIHFNHANSSIDIGADNITLKNLNLLPSITVTAIAIDIETGNTDCVLDGIRVLEGEAANGDDDFVIGVDVKAGCHDLVVRNCNFFVHASNNGCDSAIKFTGASDRAIIENNIFRGPYQVACINGDTTLSKDLVIRNNIFYQGDTEPAIELLTGTTGIICRNYIKTNLATIGVAIVADAVFCFENWYNEDAGGDADGIEMGSATSVTQTADDA